MTTTWKELDERFLNHPYQEKIRESGDDKILLEDAENRGSNPASGLKINFDTKPDNDAEQKFVVTNVVATAASERGDERAAVARNGRKWLTGSTGSRQAPQAADDPEERQWYLLALRRVEQLQNGIKDRREYVEKELEHANSARRAGRLVEAMTIQNNLLEQFGKYTDLADIFGTAASVSGRNSPEATPEPASTSSSGESDSAPVPKTAAEAKDSKAERDGEGGKGPENREGHEGRAGIGRRPDEPASWRRRSRPRHLRINRRKPERAARAS